MKKSNSIQQLIDAITNNSFNLNGDEVVMIQHISEELEELKKLDVQHSYLNGVLDKYLEVQVDFIVLEKQLNEEKVKVKLLKEILYKKLNELK